MTPQQATHFAQAWVEAFNAHDLDAILDHYAETLEFRSPLIPQLKFNESGVITARQELERYFRIGLNAYPDLHFTLHHVFLGVNSLAIYYTSIQNRLVCEVFQLNEQGKADKVDCHYGIAPVAA